MADTLRDFLPRLRKYPGAYVSRLSFITVCAFIDGYAVASDERIADLHQWLVGRGSSRPELSWPWLVLAELYPADAIPDPRSFSEQQDEQALGLLFDLLESYYGLPAQAD